MKVAWRRKTGFESANSSELPGRVLRGAMMDSSSMLKGKLACLRVTMDGIEMSSLKSFTTRRGIFSNGLILKTLDSPGLEPASTTLPATHGKLADNCLRPAVKVRTIAGWEDTSATGKQRHICVYMLRSGCCPRISR